MYVYVCIYVCMYVYVYVCMYACVVMWCCSADHGPSIHAVHRVLSMYNALSPSTVA